MLTGPARSYGRPLLTCLVLALSAATYSPSTAGAFAFDPSCVPSTFTEKPQLDGEKGQDYSLDFGYTTCTLGRFGVRFASRLGKATMEFDVREDGTYAYRTIRRRHAFLLKADDSGFDALEGAAVDFSFIPRGPPSGKAKYTYEVFVGDQV